MRILICGTGKSGTTALTYAIKKKLQDYTVIFEPANLAHLDAQEKNVIVKSLQIVQKPISEEEKISINKYDKKVLIVRNPLDVMVSLLLYDPFNRSQFNSDASVDKYINILKKKTEKPDTISFVELLNYYQAITNINLVNPIDNWCKNALEISKCKSLEFCVIKYEDFIEGNLDTLSDYLGISVDASEAVEVPLRLKRVTRTKKHSDFKNWFTEKDISVIKPYFIDFLENFNYKINIDKHEKQINPDDSYLYTIKVINDSRSKNNLNKYKLDL